MRIDFSSVPVIPAIGAEPVDTDMRRDFANIVYRNAKDILGYNLALKIFNSEGAEDYTEEEVAVIRGCTAQITYYWQRRPLEELTGGGGAL